MAKPKAKTLQESMGFCDAELATKDHDDLMIILDSNIESAVIACYPRLSEVRQFWKVKTRWEQVVGKYSGPSRTPYIVGFIDLVAHIKIDMNGYMEKFGLNHDQLCDDDHHFKDVQDIAFEVKTKLNSIGEIIRQLRVYEVHSRGMYKFCVFAPSSEKSKALESQGIMFLEAPSLGGDL